MRLSEFIEREMESILVEWEAFATTLLPATAGMSSEGLRDHARQILEAIAADLTTVQSEEEQAEKSKGRARVRLGAHETAAQTHARARAESGLDIIQLASEYRALRASVLKLWCRICGLQALHMGDLIRFNEAIDQALLESIAVFSAQVDHWRNLLLGMLGHDMRSPLQAIQLTAKYLSDLDVGQSVVQAASVLTRSSARLNALVEDLVEFNRASLGLGIKIQSSETDIAALFSDELEELRAAYPGRTIDLRVSGDTRGVWDGARLQQVLSNLVVNALKYGSAAAPVHVEVSAESEDEVSFTVKNTGNPIPREELQNIFKPLWRGVSRKDDRDESGLGLGLYISQEIAKAHGGAIDAQSDSNETVFTMRLPRRSSNTFSVEHN